MLEGLRVLVDLVGIEPTTSSMPWKRAPSCATGPRCAKTILAYRLLIVKLGFSLRHLQRGAYFAKVGKLSILMNAWRDDLY